MGETIKELKRVLEKTDKEWEEAEEYQDMRRKLEKKLENELWAIIRVGVDEIVDKLNTKAVELYLDSKKEWEEKTVDEILDEVIGGLPYEIELGDLDWEKIKKQI